LKIPTQSTNNFLYLIYSTITSSYRHLHPAVLIAGKLHKLGTTQCKMLLQSYDHASRRNSLLFISCHLKLEREGGGFVCWLCVFVMHLSWVLIRVKNCRPLNSFVQCGFDFLLLILLNYRRFCNYYFYYYFISNMKRRLNWSNIGIDLQTRMKSFNSVCMFAIKFNVVKGK